MDIVSFLGILFTSVNLIWQRIIEIVSSPFVFKEMLFILVPLVVVLLVVELYFGRYTHEKLGWNTAVGNSLALFFVGMNLLNFLYVNDLFFLESQKTILAFLVVFESLLLLVLNFFHLFPQELAFKFSSTIFLNFIGSASIIMVYSNIAFDYISFVSFFVLFLVVVLLVKFMKTFEVPAIPQLRFGDEMVPVPIDRE